jgi:H/ACA ribonucleoprotein complex subunit 3
MRRCGSCREYSLQAVCPRCGGKTLDPRPAKYSPEDHYGSYRRKLKQMERAKGPPAPKI